MNYAATQFPHDLRNKVERASRGEAVEGVDALPLYGACVGWMIGLLLGLGLFAGPTLYLSQERWLTRIDEVYLCGAGAFLGGLLLLFCASRLVRRYSSPIRPALIAAPGTIAHTGWPGTPVAFHPLDDLKEARFTPYVGLTLKFSAAATTIPCSDANAASAFAMRLSEILASKDDDPSRPSWIKEMQGASPAPAGSGPSFGFKAIKFLAFAAIAAGAAFTSTTWAWRSNGVRAEASKWRYCVRSNKPAAYRRYIEWALRQDRSLKERFPDALAVMTSRHYYCRDTAYALQGTPLEKHLAEALDKFDTASFEAAKETKVAKPLRKYIKDFSKGKHHADARAALTELFDETERRYLVKASKAGASARCVKGVEALFDYFRKDPAGDHKVNIVFLPVKGLKGGTIEAKIRKKTGSKKVHAVGPAFSAKANARRHRDIVRQVKNAFHTVAGDLFDVKEGKLEESDPRFLFRYTVLPSGTYYTRKADAKLPLSKRDIYPSIFILFAISLQVPFEGGKPLSPDPKKGYPYVFLAKPSANFRVSGRNFGPRAFAASVYNTMAETAFVDIAKNMRRAFGVGTPEKRRSLLRKPGTKRAPFDFKKYLRSRRTKPRSGGS